MGCFVSRAHERVGGGQWRSSGGAPPISALSSRPKTNGGGGGGEGERDRVVTRTAP